MLTKARAQTLNQDLAKIENNNACSKSDQDSDVFVSTNVNDISLENGLTHFESKRNSKNNEKLLLSPSKSQQLNVNQTEFTPDEFINPMDKQIMFQMNNNNNNNNLKRSNQNNLNNLLNSSNSNSDDNDQQQLENFIVQNYYQDKKEQNSNNNNNIQLNDLNLLVDDDDNEVNEDQDDQDEEEEEEEDEDEDDEDNQDTKSLNHNTSNFKKISSNFETSSMDLASSNLQRIGLRKKT